MSLVQRRQNLSHRNTASLVALLSRQTLSLSRVVSSCFGRFMQNWVAVTLWFHWALVQSMNQDFFMVLPNEWFTQSVTHYLTICSSWLFTISDKHWMKLCETIFNRIRARVWFRVDTWSGRAFMLKLETGNSSTSTSTSFHWPQWAALHFNILTVKTYHCPLPLPFDSSSEATQRFAKSCASGGLIFSESQDLMLPVAIAIGNLIWQNVQWLTVTDFTRLTFE